MGIIQGPEGPCSLRKAKTNDGKGNGKNNGNNSGNGNDKKQIPFGNDKQKE